MAIEKIKILGAVLDLSAKQPIYLKIGPNWPNQQCCLAGSSKTAPRIFIFSIAMDADYTFYVKSIETHAHAFLPLNISAVGSEASTLTYLTKHQVLLIKEKCDQSLKT